jgi:integrase
MALSDAACRAAKPGTKLRKLSDSGGLQLWVQPNGSRLWRLAYRFNGKQKLLSFGKYPFVSLAGAREGRDQAKKQLAAGTDPLPARNQQNLAQPQPGDSFKIVATEYVEKLKREQRAAATLAKKEWLLGFAYDSLGDKHVSEIKPVDVLRVLQQVELRGCYETARRLRATIGAVCRYAIATARAEADPTSALRDALTVPVVVPRAAITNAVKFGALLRAVDGFDGQPTTRAALQLMALQFPRPGELRAAEWQEFDLDGSMWTIPANRMKMRLAYRTFLSRQTVAILKSLHELTGDQALVFPGLVAGKPISENTLNGALRRLGYGPEQMTAHGFRASASTLLNESGRWSVDDIERQVAHRDRNAVRRTYARGEYWDERIKMLSWWADYLDRLKAGGTVVRLKRPGGRRGKRKQP